MVMKNLISEFQFTASTIALIGMNLIPLIGVFWFGWDAGTIVFLYWLENVVIGLLNIPKIFASRFLPQITPHRPIDGAERFNVPEPHQGEPMSGLIFVSIFFSFHYGMFCLGHYVFLKTIYKSLPGLGEFIPALLSPVLFWSLLGLTLSHVFSMVVNFYGKREYETHTPKKQMFIPYSRIMLLHIVIILSGFVALAAGQGVATLLLLVLFKIGFDLAAHVVEHSKIESLVAPSVD